MNGVLRLRGSNYGLVSSPTVQAEIGLWHGLPRIGVVSGSLWARHRMGRTRGVEASSSGCVCVVSMRVIAVVEIGRMGAVKIVANLLRLFGCSSASSSSAR